MSTMTPDWNVPADMPEHLVIDWDIYTEPKLRDDVHLGWRSLLGTAPDICWTPRNGGHWLVLRYDDQAQVLKDSEHFSSRELHIPPMFNDNVMIPLNLDPPDHARYRAVLMRYFSAGTINTMAPKIRSWANRLIDKVIDRGAVDFSEALGAAFPVSIFMELMGMPLDRFDEFRSIVLEYFSHITVERREQLQNRIFAVIRELYADKRRNPGSDLASALLNEQVRGRALTQDELESMGFLLFLGGLDTVANALTFAVRHLAMHPDLQKRLAANPDEITNFVEESLRRYAVVNQTRIVKQDVVIHGAPFRAGQMVLCPLTTAGLDERQNPDPERFDVDRPDRKHITFSVGPHFCVGNILGRLEMRLFTEAWLKRVPNFRLAADAGSHWRPGMIMALEHLALEWDVPPAQQVA
jgi:cytochrome P450